LRDLEKKGYFTLPFAKCKKSKPSPRRLEQAVPMPENVPNTTGEIKNLELVLVETEPQMRIWNEMMIREHPNGADPLMGRQLRYLINSDHG